MPEAPGAVHRGRLVELDIDGGDGGEVDDRAPAHVLPDVGRHDHRAEEARLDHEVDRFEPDQHQQVVDHPAGGRQELADQGRDHHPTDEVRQVGDGLHHLLEAARAHLVEQQRQDDRGREPEDDLVERDQQRVAEHVQELRAAEQALEVVQAHPRAAQDALQDAVLLEGDDHPVHGVVLEDQEPGDGRQQHDEQAAVQEHGTPQPALGEVCAIGCRLNAAQRTSASQPIVSHCGRTQVAASKRSYSMSEERLTPCFSAHSRSAQGSIIVLGSLFPPRSWLAIGSVTFSSSQSGCTS